MQESNQTIHLQSSDKKYFNYQFIPVLPHHHIHRFYQSINQFQKVKEKYSLDGFLRAVRASVQSQRKEFYPFQKHIDLDNLKTAFYKFPQQQIKQIIILKTSQILNQQLQILRQGENGLVEVSCQQALCLVANMFVCLMPPQLFTSRLYSFSFIHSNPKSKELLVQKELFTLNYFLRQKRNSSNLKKKKIVLSRISLKNPPKWTSSQKQLAPIQFSQSFYQDQAVIVDFANKQIGGGVLSAGSVQEQILFLKHPQALVSILLVEPLQQNETLLMRGLTKFSVEKGYGYKVQFKQSYFHQGVLGQSPIRDTLMICIDAKDFTNNQRKQYSPPFILRELNKAYIGFSNLPYQLKDYTISTGGWGCGVFKGDKELKFIIQWLAASQSNKELKYHSQDSKFIERGKQISRLLINSKTKVSEVFEIISQFEQKGRDQSFKDWLMLYGI